MKSTNSQEGSALVDFGAGVEQSGSSLGSLTQGRGSFKSRPRNQPLAWDFQISDLKLLIEIVAQLAEHRICNARSPGSSIPSPPTRSLRLRSQILKI